MAALPTDLQEALNEWKKYNKNDVDAEEINKLVQAGDQTTLRKRLIGRLAFGTAGLRGVVGAGFNCMNELVVLQTSQGLCRYLQSQFDDLKQAGVVIGYDARHRSDKFARIAASVFLSEGVRVHLFDTPGVNAATPCVPFGVLHFKAACGIMVTASHNPPRDNGYKVYWRNGVQIIPPHDGGIAASIEKNLVPWDAVDQTGALPSNVGGGLLSDPTEEVLSAYNASIRNALCFYPEENAASTLKIVYTPVHGVGHPWAQRSFQAFQLPPYIPCDAQVKPDPDFSTVPFPNPEEKGVLDLAEAQADQIGARLIVANDPDADRLAVAEKSTTWRVFSGNELGSLLGWWLWYNWDKKNKGESKQQRPVFLASTVSSKQLKAVAAKEGLLFEETLTGFKWLGNKAVEMQAKGHPILLAYEEAIGFMCGMTVRDKVRIAIDDGVSAAAVCAEMANYLHRAGKTLADQLEVINTTYGHFISNNGYYVCRSKQKIDQIFDRMRTMGQNGSYVTQCGPHAIAHVRDLTTGYDSSQADHRATLPVSSSSQMITFTFANGCVATIRTSGTEPKVKYYIELGGTGARSEIETRLKDVVHHIITTLLQPEENQLELTM